ncbi:MAG TPA: hypothetical protein VJL07_02530 [Dehalococcoidia bacterium]|nr:hypothetical protein [Dehalococcoidia bacterium]
MSKQKPDPGRSLAWDPSSCEVLEKVPRFLDKTATEVSSELGEPAKKDSFKLGERQDEFRIELQNTYPLTNPENRDVQVREWTWEEKDCNLTLWFHQVDEGWVVFETMKWNDGTEF